MDGKSRESRARLEFSPAAIRVIVRAISKALLRNLYSHDQNSSECIGAITYEYTVRTNCFLYPSPSLFVRIDLLPIFRSQVFFFHGGKAISVFIGYFVKVRLGDLYGNLIRYAYILPFYYSH